MPAPSSLHPASDVFAEPVTAAVMRHLALAPAASMQDLAAAAGISRATLFRRFPSRDALVEQLCELACRALVAAIAEAAPEQGTPTDALARVLDHLGHLASVAGLLGLQPLDGRIEEALLAQIATTEDDLRALVRRGQEDGSFRFEVDPEWLLAMVVWLSVAGADTVRLGRITPASAQRHLVATITAALVRPSAGSR